MADVPKKSFADKLQSINKPTLFLILILCTSVPLFFSGLQVPNEPEQPTIDLYKKLMEMPEGSTVLLESDWTNSTRGESGGQFKALLRILMRKKLKVCIYTAADPQAPKVSRDTMRALNAERTAKGEAPYKEWEDWLNIGYFPSAEGTAVSMGSDIRKAFAGKKAMSPTGSLTDVFQSPVLSKVRKIADIPLLIVMTASNTSKVVIERLYGKVPLAMMVTGVMGPETQVYYDSGQLIGLSKGLKGVYDIEILMDLGVPAKNIPPGFPGAVNRDQGSLYYPTLHFALTLLILAVIIGNIGMALGRRKG
jgi:hypothetical protein